MLCVPGSSVDTLGLTQATELWDTTAVVLSLWVVTSLVGTSNDPFTGTITIPNSSKIAVIEQPQNNFMVGGRSPQHEAPS